MKRTVLLVLLLVGYSEADDSVRVGASSSKQKQGDLPAPGYRYTFRWQPSLQDAKKEAAKEHKTVLHFELIGNLDKTYC